jgi:hypothetical protein
MSKHAAVTWDEISLDNKLYYVFNKDNLKWKKKKYK